MIEFNASSRRTATGRREGIPTITRCILYYPVFLGASFLAVLFLDAVFLGGGGGGAVFLGGGGDGGRRGGGWWRRCRLWLCRL